MSLDYVGHADFLVAFLPEIVLCVWGMVVLLASVSKRSAASTDSAPLGHMALIGVVMAAVANAWLYGVVDGGTAEVISVDSFRLFANWIVLAGGALSILLSLPYVDRQGLQAGELYALLIFAMVGAMVMAGSGDLIVIFLGLEVMSVSLYALTAINRRDRRSAEAGMKYFLLGAFSTAFFLFGLTLVWGATASTSIVEIGAAIAAGGVDRVLLLPGVALLLVGFGFKVAAVPFHMWAPDVYEGAPLPITAFMSTAVKAAAFIAFFRVFYIAFAPISADWTPALWWLSVATMVTANLIALVQNNVKRMLAYSSVAHAGYLLVALVALNETAGAALLFYLLVYTFMNIGAFAVVMGVALQREDRLHVEDYMGLGRRHPVIGVVFTIFLLSLAGFPGTGGFMAKAYLLIGAAEAELWSLSVVLVLTTAVSYVYYLRLARMMWMEKPPEESVVPAPIFPLTARIVLGISAVFVVAMGVFPALGIRLAREGIVALVSGLGAAGPILP